MERSKVGGEGREEKAKSYLGETERALKGRFQQHSRLSTTSLVVPRHIHINLPGHAFSF